MATSGSANWTQTRNEIIADAYYNLGVYRTGATISTNDSTFASNVLNRMIKGWENKGIHIWTEEEGALFLTNNQAIYTLSDSTTARVGKNPVQTNLTAACTSTIATVSSTIGMTAADNIGIALDNNTLHWTTIVSVDSSTQVTLTAAPASTASSGNSIFTYTTAVGRPLFLTGARLQMQSGIERTISIIGHTEFMALAIKQTQGPVTQIHYSPKSSSGLLYVYLVPNNVNECIRFSYARSIEDFDNSTDNPDLPQEWYDALELNLECRLARAKGIDLGKNYVELTQQAASALLEAQMYDVDIGSVKIIPNDRWDDWY